MSSSQSTQVVIIGAGLGGLALAQGLKKHGIPFSVFERDPTADYRLQGYRIKVFADTVADLQYILTPELWHDFESTCATTALGETTLNALDATLIASRAVWSAPRPYTVDRTVLRNVLLKGLEKNVYWSKTFVGYDIQGDHVIAKFHDGSTEKGGLLIGADGVRSVVRKQYLPDHKTVDVEGCCIYGKTPLSDTLVERFPAKALRWLTLCRDATPVFQEIIVGNNPITLIVDAMRFPNTEKRSDVPPDYVYWAILIRKQLLAPTDEALTKVLQTPPRDLSLRISSEWDPSIRSLLELQDHASAIPILSADPQLLPWSPNAHVTLLGDAVHVMSPAGGVGAVTAFKDAATLTRALVKDGFLESSVGAYESSMREYAGAALRRSFAGGNKMYNQPPFEHCKVVNL